MIASLAIPTHVSLKTTADTVALQPIAVTASVATPEQKDGFNANIPAIPVAF